MIQSQYFQSSFPHYNIEFMGDLDFEFSSLTASEESNDISSNQSIPTDVSSSTPFDIDVDSFMFEEMLPISITPSSFFDEFGWIEESEPSDSVSPHDLIYEDPNKSNKGGFLMKSGERSIHSSLVFPSEDMEVDNDVSILHLLKAYGDAMENKQSELVEVVVKCTKKKVSPIGTTTERLAYHLFAGMENEDDYLKQESIKNYQAAFETVYKYFPHGKIAHFTANLAIIETIPNDTETIIIVDLNLGEGIQWPSLIEAIGKGITVRLISIKWTENCDGISHQWGFEETKERLNEYAKLSSTKLVVEEMEMEEMASEVMRIRKMGRGREFFAFNCMMGLPHMGKGRSRKQVSEFLEVSKQLIRKTSTTESDFGIITLGDGDVLEDKVRHSHGFGSFFEGCLQHFNALFESIELNFPSHLREARIAIECLFLAPYVSAEAWVEKWEESRQGLIVESDMNGWTISRNNLMQGKEIAREGEGSYEVRVEGETGNAMVLHWRGTPLVRVSSWR